MINFARELLVICTDHKTVNSPGVVVQVLSPSSGEAEAKPLRSKSALHKKFQTKQSYKMGLSQKTSKQELTTYCFHLTGSGHFIT